MPRRFCQAPVDRLCRPRLTPVIVLPRIMPSIGMAYLGSNQGSGRTCVVSANTVTRIEAVIIAVVPSPYPQMPENRRSWRANASQPANKIMMSAATPVQSGDVRAKRPLRTSPINRSCATIRRAAISNLPSRRRRSHIDRAASINNKPAAIARSATSRAMSLFIARQFRICPRPGGGPDAQNASPARRHA